jgi:hypothetical protein
MLAGVREPNLHLVPRPKRIRFFSGEFCLRDCSRLVCDAPHADAALEAAAHLVRAARGALIAQVEVARRPTAQPGVIALRVARLSSSEHYTIVLGLRGAELVGGGAAGLFYAVQTFAQLMRQSPDGFLPALRIEDGPDYPARGFYHDVSRGKVPTRDTLCALVEKLAFYKLNQLQLYIEHTFAFRHHPDIWAGSDPLTTDDIRAVDEHAARHHVELVPSLSTFGHFYPALVSPRKAHLNEFPLDASQLPFSVWDRMGHYTLDCRNPASLELVRELILELRPLFRSNKFNLCCDETFDLGRGRNADFAARHGTGRLYVDFLKKLVRIVRAAGCTPMFWGDIIGNHPELVRELPRNVIALDWDYSANLKDTKSRLFRRARVPFYVCPGVCGWDRWIHDLDTATANITRFAQQGRRDGASGLLNTDWGDRGHINPLGNSWHGLALGAAAAWHTRAAGADAASGAFDVAFGAFELDDASGRAVALMREAGRMNVVSWRLLTLWLDPTPHRPTAWWDARTDLPVDLLKIDPRRAFAAAGKLERIGAKLRRVIGSSADDEEGDPERILVGRELLLGCRGSALMNALGGWLVCLANGQAAPRGARPALEVANEIRRFEQEFSNVWHARNRPSEYWRVRTTLLELARRLDLATLRGGWLKTPRDSAPEL